MFFVDALDFSVLYRKEPLGNGSSGERMASRYNPSGLVIIKTDEVHDDFVVTLEGIGGW
jgi:hypothetical protein